VLDILVILVWGASIAVLAMVGVVAAELAAAWNWGRRIAPDGVSPDRVRSTVQAVVLMPAHNEESTIGGTLEALMPLLGDGNRVLVVADNCTDNTAAEALAHGAYVVERNIPGERGKGYALEFGRAHLEENPPGVVIVLDADCRLSAGSASRLAEAAHERGGPVQAVYLMDPPAPATSVDAVSVFAVRIKNHLRPLGLSRLGGPCLLVGSGMAIPWPQFARAPLDGRSMVEDLQMGVDLAIAGAPAHLCRDVVVRSVLPSGRPAAVTQRTRWEHGHLRLIMTQAPRLVWAGLRTGRPALVALGAELAVPPLSLLVLSVAAVMLASAAFALVTGSSGPLVASSASGALLFAALGLHARGTAMPIGPVSVARYIMMKLPIYTRFTVARQREWVRTPRANELVGAPGARRPLIESYQHTCCDSVSRQR
jgi:cellulose synthase/poly-beta-1,6-N-acetylglucosamine synthase-like glycosyltransferase